MSYSINDGAGNRRSRKDSINEVIDLDAPANQAHHGQIDIDVRGPSPHKHTSKRIINL
jgi:hypothetical protein